MIKRSFVLLATVHVYIIKTTCTSSVHNLTTCNYCPGYECIGLEPGL